MKKMLMALFLLLSFTGCKNNPGVELLDYSGSMAKYFDTIGIEYEEKNSSILFIRKTKENYENFLVLFSHLLLKRDVINNNIQNADTTRTVEGGSFTRRYVILNVRGESEIILDTSRKKRLVWDPSHPDAIKSGPQKGYVEFPNVYKDEELNDLHYTENDMNIVLSVLKTFNPGLIIEIMDRE